MKDLPKIGRRHEAENVANRARTRYPAAMVLGKALLFSTAASAAIVLACSGPPATLEGGMVSTVQGGIYAPSATCQRAGDFVDVPLAGADPSTVIVPNGTQGIQLNCSIIPQATGGYDVTVSASVQTGTSPGTVTFTGIFTPRIRDASGKPTSDTTQIPGIRGIFQDDTGVDLFQKDCYAQYTTADPSLLSGSSLPDAADTYADGSGGRIWVSVFCPDAINQNAGNQITKACQGTATFRFENCSSHP